jgi:hypothetical protein
MHNAIHLTPSDDTRRIDSPSYPPPVALATAWHRYRSGAPQDRRPLRLTRRGRIVRDMTIGAAILSATVFALPLSDAGVTAVSPRRTQPWTSAGPSSLC